MQLAGAIEVFLLGALFTGIVLAWDGLVRRHIRLTREVISLQLDIRGLPATLLGIVGLILIVYAIKVGGEQLGHVVGTCAYATGCIVQNLVVPVLYNWPAVIVFIIAITAFSLWLRGAGDRGGPYMRRPIAFGVWDDEKVLVDRVNAKLHAAGLPPVASDSVIRIASQMRRVVAITSLTNPQQLIRGEQLSLQTREDAILRTGVAERYRLSGQQARILVHTVAQYYEDLYMRAGRAYTWKRRGGKC